MTAKTPQEMNMFGRLDDLLSRLGVRDRTSIEKHLAVCDAERNPGHAILWRRLAGTLGALVSLPMQSSGPQAVIFFVPDGKYRMQVFALEDCRDGLISLYLQDVLGLAVREKILAKAGDRYAVAGAKSHVLAIQSMDATNTPDPPLHVKHMIGWNRKAIRITLNTSEPDSPQVDAVESLCALAAKQWTVVAPR